ncbi:MAG: PDZ domain-containing protein [Betaproteobacteria bacterium]|nr:MAG: PDZ domain-containing protein [Betaproteobacteria bacterium]
MFVRRFVFLLLFLPLAALGQLPDFTQLAREQGAAVVNIGSAYVTPPVLPDLPQDDLLREFLERLASGELVPDFEPRPLGSGFIIRGDGTIVTGAHVVEDAFNDEVVVRLADRREFVGRVIGVDAQTDIAVVKIDAAGLPQVRIGDPKRLQPGEWVATIGSPFGFERSVTAGIVSAVGRAIPTEAYIPFIQSDVAMNPGNSGGPLFNLRGEVVGVNSLIFSASGGYMGLSFAVPIDVALEAVEQLLAHGKVTRGRIGVRLQEVTAELARALRLPGPAGALVTMVEPASTAEAAGLRAGDVIVRFGAKPVATHADLMRLVAASTPGASVELGLVRDGVPSSAKVRVMAPERPRPRLADTGSADRLGFQLAPLTDAQRKRLGLEYGLLVQRAEGAARRAGLLPGDVILAVNGDPTRTLAGFLRSVAKAESGDVVALLIERAGGRAFVPLRIP